MRLAQAFIIALSVASAPAALARTPRQLHGFGAVLKSERAKPKARTFAAQCANFSGSWSGTCVDAHGESENVSITVAQDDCESISMDGLFVDIFGATTMTLAPAPGNEFGSATLIQTYSWNDSQTRLTGMSNMSFWNGGLAAISGQAIWLDGDQLRVKDTFSTPVMDSNGPTGWSFNATDCTYTRAP
jgi:hypothetical protein